MAVSAATGSAYAAASGCPADFCSLDGLYGTRTPVTSRRFVLPDPEQVSSVASSTPLRAASVA